MEAKVVDHQVLITMVLYLSVSTITTKMVEGARILTTNTNACEQCFENNLDSLVQFATLQRALEDGVLINIGAEIDEVHSLRRIL